MSKIELHPLVIDEIKLQQPGEAVQLWLAPRLEAPKPGDVWTEGDTKALIDVIAPFVGTDEAAARQVLAQATTTELAEAFGRAMPLVSRAYEAVQDFMSRRDRDARKRE